MEDAILRLVHISGSVIWAGAAVLIGWFLIPSVQEAGPAGGAVMGGIMRRKLSPILTVLSWLTILTGIRLYQMRFSAEWMTTPNGLALTLGGGAAIGAALIGSFVQRPTALRMAAIGDVVRAAGGPPKPEQGTELKMLGVKLALAAKTSAALLIASVLLMAASRASGLF